jgi:hypothetical protein
VNRFRIHRPLLLLFVSAFCFNRSLAQSTSTIGRLTITDDVDKPLSVTLDDLRHMPRTKLKVMSPHTQKEDTYESVLLTELLKRTGVPLGAQLRGAAIATYVQADASDGYRAIFSLPELDADFQDSNVIVADTMNGAPLDDKTGPFRLVAPHDRRPARWVKMVQSLTVVRIPK